MRDDEQLVTAALAGSDEAFGELVDRYQHRLLRFLCVRCTNRADAEDALQDTFINAYRYLASFNSRWRFSTWLYRIALREAARQRSPSPFGAEFSTESCADPLEECIAAGDRENLWLVAKKRLSAEAYAAFWLHYVEEMTHRQVGLALDRSLPWVKVTLHRGRRRLRNELAATIGMASKGEAYG